MNGCERYELLASLVIDEEATLEEQAELESHLESCPGCRAYFEDIKRLHEVLTPEKIVLPEDFHTRVMDLVRQTEQDIPEDGKTKKTVPFPHWRRWAALAACCAIAVLSVWGVRSGSGRNGDAPAGGVPQAADARSMPQDAGAQAEDADVVEDEVSVLSEAAPPPLPEEYEDLAKSAAKEGLSEGTYLPPVDDTGESEQNESGSLGMMPSAQDVPEPASNGGEEDAPVYEDGQETPLAGPADGAAEPVLTDTDGEASADRENKPEAPTPAPETEAEPEEPEPEEPEPEEPEAVLELEPVEVINAPEEGVLIAFAGGAAQIWVENVLGLEWAGGGSYTLSMEQYRDLLEVLREAGEPYNIKPGEGYCLMTE